MPGRTGYPELDDGSEYDPAGHMTDIEEHFDALIGESKPTASDLPTSGNWVGRLIMAEDTGILYRCTGLPNTWRRLFSPFAEAAGEATTSGATGSSSAPVYWSGNETVTFPVGRFTEPPIVTATPAANASGTILLGIQVHDITTSGFTYKVMRINAAPASGTKIHWHAIQMTASTAAG